MPIKISYEGKRGCGYRKKGGLYLVADGPLKPCGRLPIPLESCPVCGSGIKAARGWTWIGAELIEAHLKKVSCASPNCKDCPLNNGVPFEDKAGLLWVGEKFYRGPDEFMDEAWKMGISRRLAHIPKRFKLGETWVLLAHRFAIGQGTKEARPGIFTLFRPERVEQIVRGDEPEAEIKAIEKRGFTPVIVKRLEEKPKNVEEEGL